MGECTGLPRLHAVQLTGLVALEQKQPVELVGLGTRERHNGLAVSAQAERQIDEMVGLEARVLGREARGARELPREVVGGAELFGPGARRAFGELRRQQLAILEHEPVAFALAPGHLGCWFAGYSWKKAGGYQKLQLLEQSFRTAGEAKAERCEQRGRGCKCLSAAGMWGRWKQ